jgi:hypothetical protein
VRGITENERALLNHISRWGSSGYPVAKCGSHHWAWGPFLSIQGAPVVFKTKRECVQSFENFLEVLRDAVAGRI